MSRLTAWRREYSWRRKPRTLHSGDVTRIVRRYTETHSVGRNPISFHPAKRPHLFRANVPPRLRHREFCELISKRVQADGIFEFPNVCYFQRMGRGSPGKIRKIFFLSDVRQVSRFFPNFIQRSRPNLAERETAVKNSIRGRNIYIHMAYFRFRHASP